MIARAWGGLGRVTRAIARWARGHLALWIVGAGAVDAALVALVPVLIALPRQSDATISGLLLAFGVLLVLSVVFPVAGHVVKEREARRERIDPLLDRGSSERLPRLSELTDEELGAAPTRYSMGNCAPYVARGDADEKIRSLLAAPGPPYPFVIVWGTTKAGKSRTLAEALRATFAHDPAVVLPYDEQALAKLARLGVEDLVDRRPAVVVLDDLSPTELETLTGDVLNMVGMGGNRRDHDRSAACGRAQDRQQGRGSRPHSAGTQIPPVRAGVRAAGRRREGRGRAAVPGRAL